MGRSSAEVAARFEDKNFSLLDYGTALGLSGTQCKV
jgi:hypothetical protein